MERLGYGLFPRPSGKCCISWLTSVCRTGMRRSGGTAGAQCSTSHVPGPDSIFGLCPRARKKEETKYWERKGRPGRRGDRRRGNACRQQLVITIVYISRVFSDTPWPACIRLSNLALETRKPRLREIKEPVQAYSTRICGRPDNLPHVSISQADTPVTARGDCSWEWKLSGFSLRAL